MGSASRLLRCEPALLALAQAALEELAEARARDRVYEDDAVRGLPLRELVG